MNELLPISAGKSLIPYEKKQKRPILLLVAVALAAGLFCAVKFGVFSAVGAFFFGKPAENAPSIYEFDRTLLSDGAKAILPVDLSAKAAGRAFSEPLPFPIDDIPSHAFAAEGKRTVLIINTHPFECYSPDGAYEYTDAAALSEGENTVRICANVLMQELKARGIPAFYVESPAVSARNAYKNADTLLTQALAEHPDTALIIDLHRAVLVAENGDLYRPLALVDGEKAAQMRLVVATGEGGEDEIRDRLGVAMTLARAIYAKCPTLMMPICLSPSRLNQNKPVPVVTAEIGTCGNSIEETTRTTVLLGETLASLLEK